MNHYDIEYLHRITSHRKTVNKTISHFNSDHQHFYINSSHLKCYASCDYSSIPFHFILWKCNMQQQQQQLQQNHASNFDDSPLILVVAACRRRKKSEAHCRKPNWVLEHSFLRRKMQMSIYETTAQPTQRYEVIEVTALLNWYAQYKHLSSYMNSLIMRVMFNKISANLLIPSWLVVTSLPLTHRDRRLLSACHGHSTFISIALHYFNSIAYYNWADSRCCRYDKKNIFARCDMSHLKCV